MMQVLVNPTDVVFRKSQHEFAALVGGPVCDIVAVDNDEVIGHLLLEVQEADTRLYMSLKNEPWHVTFDNPEFTRDTIDTLAAQFNLAVDWKAMGLNL